MAVLKCMLKHLSLKTCVEKDLMSYFGMCAHINLHQREYRKPGLCSAALHRVTAVYLSEYQHLCLRPCSWNALERDTRLAVALISIFSLSASRLAELCYFYPYWKKKKQTKRVYFFNLFFCSKGVVWWSLARLWREVQPFFRMPNPHHSVTCEAGKSLKSPGMTSVPFYSSVRRE